MGKLIAFLIILSGCGNLNNEAVGSCPPLIERETLDYRIQPGGMFEGRELTEADELRIDFDDSTFAIILLTKEFRNRRGPYEFSRETTWIAENNGQSFYSYLHTFGATEVLMQTPYNPKKEALLSFTLSATGSTWFHISGEFKEICL